MSESNSLSPEVVALVHHIELNKAGWWDTAMQRMLLTVLYVRQDAATLSITDITSTLRGRYDVTLENEVIRNQLTALTQSGEVLEPSIGRFKASEPALRRCQSDIEEATDLETDLRTRFDELLMRHCPSADRNLAWSTFNERFLIPLVRQLGASTYELLTGAKSFNQLPQVEEFVKCFAPEQAIGLNKFLQEFLNPADASLRRFVLRTMNAFFVVSAGGLSREIVKRLESTAQPFAATWFLDSNVLFSLLGLHENPADESSRSLLSLVKKLSTSTPIKLRVLPSTLGTC